MLASAMAFRASQEAASSQKSREKAEQALTRIHNATVRIRYMTELYRERLEGRRANQP